MSKRSNITHICVTHSPLVTRVYQAAMLTKQVPIENQLILGRRSVLPEGSEFSLDPISDQLEKSFKKGNRSAYQKTRKKLYNLLKKYAPNRFEVTLPHLNQIIYQEIVSHPLCQGYYFAEEGFTSMNWHKYNSRNYGKAVPLKLRLRRLLTGSSFQPAREMFDAEHTSCLGAFAISPHAFEGMPKRLDVSPHIPALQSAGEVRTLYAVLDSCYLNQGIAWEDYLHALTQNIEKLYKAGDKVCIKFHFADREREKHFTEVTSALPEINLTLLDSAFCIEDALCADDLVIFGLTSLGYYASLLGCESHSFCNDIKGFDFERWVAKGWLPQQIAISLQD